MRKIFLVLVLLVFCTAVPSLKAAEKKDPTLIPVKPSFQEASYIPNANRVKSAPIAAPSGPTPKEQLYVFWIVGKILSYPVDTAESFIRGMLTKATAKPAVVPANGTIQPDPFKSVGMREIPPAPPALGEGGQHAR